MSLKPKRDWKRFNGMDCNGYSLIRVARYLWGEAKCSVAWTQSNCYPWFRECAQRGFGVITHRCFYSLIILRFFVVSPAAEIQWWFHLVLWKVLAELDWGTLAITSKLTVSNNLVEAVHDVYGDINIIKNYGTICRRAGTCGALSESVHRAPGTLSSQPGFNKSGTAI